jgi:DNA-binding PadR family transcriptional regulator
MGSSRLGAFEELVLLAVTALGPAAYGANLQRALEEHARRPVSLGAVHSVLERLEGKGLVRSVMSDPISERGGRRRRVFTPSADGTAALREAEAARQRLVAASEVKSS